MSFLQGLRALDWHWWKQWQWGFLVLQVANKLENMIVDFVSEKNIFWMMKDKIKNLYSIEKMCGELKNIYEN